MSSWERWGRVVLRRLVGGPLVLFPALAVANEPAPAASTATPATPTTPATRLDDTRYADAHCDHVLWASTAETHPRGTLFITDYEVVMPHVGYAASDRFEVLLTWLAVSWIDFAMKANVYRGDVLRTAVIGAFDIPTRLPDPQPMGRLGVAQQLCFSSVCWSSLSLNGFVNWDATDAYPASHTNFIVLAGGIFALGRVVKILVEPQWVWDGSSHPIFGVGGGVRFSGARFGFDIGFVPAQYEGEQVPLPWLAFTYRTAGERPGK